MMMARYIWIGILSISFCCGHVFAQKTPLRCIKVKDGKQSFFITKYEVPIQDYRLFVEIIRYNHGEDSEQYKSAIPDTAKFRELYGFSFFLPASHYLHKKGDKIDEASEDLLIKHWTFPMVAISYEQAMAYCQWEENGANKRDKSYIWQYNLLTKADYEMLLNKARITQRKALSPLHRKGSLILGLTNSDILPKKNNQILGLTDNVAEYMQDGMVVEGGENTVLKFVEAKDSENPIGFRVKATVVSKKKK